MPAIGSGHSARLHASEQRVSTRPDVTVPSAQMPACCQRQLAWQPASDHRPEARHIVELAMPARTVFHGQHGARRALRLAVTAVGGIVCARVSPGALPVAARRELAARDRRESDARAALAIELVEADIRARAALARVARPVALVALAGQLSAARLLAEVHLGGAAHLRAAMVAAALPGATPRRAEECRSACRRQSRDVRAFDELARLAAPTAHTRRQPARGTGALVTRIRAQMLACRLALVAGRAARGNLIQAAPAVAIGRVRLHQILKRGFTAMAIPHVVR